MGENAELKTLIKKRGNFKARQTNFKKYFDPLMQQININDIKNVDRGIILELEARLTNHDAMWEEFKGYRRR